MSIKSKIKGAVKFVLGSIPARKFNVQVVDLAPNELLKGRTAFVTGGTSGIGFHIARAFLRSGAMVVITGRSETRVQEACAKLNVSGEYSDRVFGIEMDNTQVSTFRDRFEKALDLVRVAGAEERYIDILVNNAGVLGGNITNATEEEYDKVLDTNLKGAFFLAQLFGRYMKENRIEGNILNIASSAALRPAASAYTLSKWGIRGLTLGLAKSLAPYGITVNGLAPGPTATPMLMGDDHGSITNNGNPIGRYALPEEIAGMAVVLTSAMGKTVIGDIVYMTGGAGVVTYDDMDYSF